MNDSIVYLSIFSSISAYLKKNVKQKEKNPVLALFLLCLCLSGTVIGNERLGVIICPVADLFGQADRAEHFAHMPMPVAGSAEQCPRMHQLLFNQTVELLQETEHAYHIRIPHLYFITAQNTLPHDTYWIHKKCVMPLHALPRHIDPKKLFPPVIDYHKKDRPTTTPIITLKQPWYSKTFGFTFSAGTRFIARTLHKNGYAGIAAWHPHKGLVHLRIPAAYCIPHAQDKQTALCNYNRLLKSHAHEQGFIPYVWGGCSFTYLHPADTLFCMASDGATYTLRGDRHVVKHGFDCAGLIAHAAQVAGMPYYFKNTATLAACLKPVAAYHDLIEGDLFGFRVM